MCVICHNILGHVNIEVCVIHVLDHKWVIAIFMRMMYFITTCINSSVCHVHTRV